MTNPRRQHFNDLATEWDHLPDPPDTERVRDFVRRSDAPGASRILDVGCGTGILMPHLQALYCAASCFVEQPYLSNVLVPDAFSM
jgi:2-polyprenyl-3-methyl-5-hydroxy-6-metoxy-1,4-benzoquinol methylase